ncbi:MAG: hypothetical protein K0S63_617 [Gammaproteobacteria bacterium]|nr:hypothetical protein [Gammaproteobacteria bacterium]
MKRLTLTLLCLLATITSVQAKEITVVIENHKSAYPITVHYKISSKNYVYGEDAIENIKADEKYFVYVNRVPDEKILMVQLDKITVGRRTAINDPCEIKLNKNDLQANLTVGFEGDPETHGSFTCAVSVPKLSR